MTKQTMIDMVLQNIQLQLAADTDIHQRISKAFTQWFQQLIEPPQQPQQGQEQGGGGDAGGAAPAPAAPAGPPTG